MRTDGWDNPTSERLAKLVNEIIWFGETYGWTRNIDKKAQHPEYQMSELENTVVQRAIHIIWEAAIVLEWPNRYRPTAERRIEEDE